jgi:transcriptional regulator with XRE-family HTH domain
MKIMTQAKLDALIRRRIAEVGSQCALARELEISEGYLSDVLRAKKAPGAKMLRGLGLVRVVGYASVA